MFGGFPHLLTETTMPQYSSVAPSLQFFLPTPAGEVLKKFKQGVLELSDEEAELFDALLSERPDLSSTVRKIDRDAALAVASEFLAEQARRESVVTGTFTSGNSTDATVRAAQVVSDAVAQNIQPPASLTGLLKK